WPGAGEGVRDRDADPGDGGGAERTGDRRSLRAAGGGHAARARLERGIINVPMPVNGRDGLDTHPRVHETRDRVVLVHDYLLVMRGAERTFAAIADCWPE